MIANRGPFPDPQPAVKPRGPAADEKPNWWLRGFYVLVILMAGSAFLFKLVDFLITFHGSAGNETLGFAIMPVVTYLIVAAGFACLFFWAYLTGQFRDIEAAKYRMLDMQDELDRGEYVPQPRESAPPADTKK